MRLGAPTVGPGGDVAAIVAVVEAAQMKLRYCWQRGANRVEGPFQGDVVLRFVIGTDGAVSEHAVAESTLPAEVATCASVLLAKFTFPAADAPVEVRYPMALGPGPH